MSEDEKKEAEAPAQEEGKVEAETVAPAAQQKAAPAEKAAKAAKASKAADSAEDETRAMRKTRIGVVVSDSMEKTIVVGVVRRVPHPRFKKIIKR
ncbi:MAG: 30S ribosomal protein S17, partial [Verrucomicrobiales bacterium]